MYPLIGLVIGFLLFALGKPKLGLVVGFATILLFLYQYAATLTNLTR